MNKSELEDFELVRTILDVSNIVKNHSKSSTIILVIVVG
jgi:hypothetical protein